MQRAGAVCHRQRVARADVLGEVLFEAFGLGPGRDPSGTQGVDDFAFFLGAHRGPMKGYLSHSPLRRKKRPRGRIIVTFRHLRPAADKSSLTEGSSARGSIRDSSKAGQGGLPIVRRAEAMSQLNRRFRRVAFPALCKWAFRSFVR